MRLRAALIGIALGFAALSSVAQVQGSVGYYYQGDAEMWARIFREKAPFAVPSGSPLGAIAPHHDLAILSLSRFYQALALQTQPPAIVLLSPNHFEAGEGEVLIPEGTVFESPDGALAVDTLLSTALLQSGAAATDSGLWKDEHGIFAHVPFIGHFFPGARFLPIVLRPGCPREKVLHLAEVLDHILPPGSLVIGSVDFSHYQIHAVAEHHDQATWSTIQNFETNLVSGLDVDSPETVLALMEYCLRRGARRASLVARSSSWDYSRRSDAETTSHQYWVFTEGEPAPRRSLSLFVPGSMAPEPELGLRRAWSWDRYGSSTEAGVRALSRVAGKEGRFLMGFDLYLLDAAPGDTSLAVHGLDVMVASRTLGSGPPVYPEPRSGSLNVALWTGPTSDPIPLLLESLALGFDLALWRGPANAMLALISDPGTPPRIVDLGAFLAPGSPISGSVALLTWGEGRWAMDTFEYHSADGYPPAIHQFGE